MNGLLFEYNFDTETLSSYSVVEKFTDTYISTTTGKQYYCFYLYENNFRTFREFLDQFSRVNLNYCNVIRIFVPDEELEIWQESSIKNLIYIKCRIIKQNYDYNKQIEEVKRDLQNAKIILADTQQDIINLTIKLHELEDKKNGK